MSARGRAAGLAVALVLGPASVARAEEAWEGLQGLHHVSVAVDLAAEPGRLTADALRHRIEGMLTRQPLGPFTRPEVPDRLRVTVAVRPYGAAELRGFWLPFSGTYGIGPVRLAVERRVVVSGVAAPVPAAVWQAERPVAAPWRGTEARILETLETLVGAFLRDYRRANP